MDSTVDIRTYIKNFDKEREKKKFHGLCITHLIKEVCKLKEINHPGFTKRQSCLISNIVKLEEELGMTLYPNQVDSVFWINFKSFLKEKYAITLSTC